MATAKKKPAKAAHAPYGLKKDGTPKQKPGVKVGSKAPMGGMRRAVQKLVASPGADNESLLFAPTGYRVEVAATPRDQESIKTFFLSQHVEPVKRISEIDDQMGRLAAVVVEAERAAADIASALAAVLTPAPASGEATEEALASSPLGTSLMELRGRLQRAVKSIRSTIDSLAL